MLLIKFYNRIKKSIFFRYEYQIKKIKENKIEKAKKTHFEKISICTVQDFSIISANCWGGSVYEDLKLPYLTPTVGLFFFAPCFLKFLKDLKNKINETPVFINESKYPEANEYRTNKVAYPIGKISDIEIHFLHYENQDIALEKWEKRKKRINWDNLFIACTDRDRMTESLMKEFDVLPFEKKVIFTANEFKNIRNAKFLRAYSKENEVGDLYNQRYYVTPNFDVKQWLNN